MKIEFRKPWNAFKVGDPCGEIELPNGVNSLHVLSGLIREGIVAENKTPPPPPTPPRPARKKSKAE